MVKIVVSGAAGRMGSRILSLAGEDKEIKLVGAVDAPGNKAFPDSLEKVLPLADVLIDFSSPSASLSVLETAARLGRAAVLGTTGHTPDVRRQIEAMGGKIPLVFAANMSVGVNVMERILEEAARALMGGFAVSVSEIHHVHKKDKPSGTALEIVRLVAGARGVSPDRIPVESRREGEVVGDHTVVFDGAGESLTVTHHAKSRDTFALGALRAAKWVAGKGPGLYTMRDVLGL